MDKNRNRFNGLAKLYASTGLIVALITAVSLAAFAETGHVESSFGVKAKGERAGTKATPSRSSRSLAAPLFAKLPGQSSLQELLEQESDNGDAIIPTWFQVSLNGVAIVNSDNWNVTIERNKKIKPDTAVKHQLKVTIYPQANGLGAGDSVTWNLGRIEGLSLESEFWEELVLSGGVHVGDVMLCYTENSDIILYTEFKEEVNMYSSITITYWYDCGFVPVDEPTQIMFDLPGYDEPIPAVLLPENGSTTEPEETTAEESSPQETTEEETTAEESSPSEATEEETTAEESSLQETTEEETTAEESSASEATEAETTTEEIPPEETHRPTKDSGSGRDSGSDREEITFLKETTNPERIPESSTETETEAEPPAEESQFQEKNLQNEKPAESTGESEEALDINISLGTEVVASHGMQSLVLPNGILTYKIVLRNDSEEEIKDVRIRDYLPEHTSFVSVEDEGIYGVIDGQQYITWLLERILPGEEREITFQVKVFLCTPPDYPVRNRVYWQADDGRSANNQERPENQVDFPLITIG
ncbi:DUF11 domain-containing protein [Lacrimispora indolis]|uniref:DUF11 domain-containing protein n=1 Tax=Lacrimispora indolis TaxID=69825 RepID=UPI00045E945C|nr:DUF11 domain-containing protein [Lacrimispora indolis]